jgi:ankyrin repeat protein
MATPLYYASLAGLQRTVELLLEKGAYVNAQGGRYGSALQAASSRGYKEIVQLLLELEGLRSAWHCLELMMFQYIM